MTQALNVMPKTNLKSGKNERYTIEKRLGDGGFCEVFRGRDTVTNRIVAIKQTDRTKAAYKKYSDTEVEKKIKKIMYREASIMKALNHPNLVKYYDMHDEDNKIYLVIELAEGGELFDFIIKRGKLTEHDAARIIKQLADGINYMHIQGYIHRDIKPENVLFKKADDSLEIVVTDFGLSRAIDDNMLTSCGTMDYSAPELLKAKSTKVPYNHKIDNWSIGVVTYILLSGYPPFYSLNQDDQEIKKQIFTATYQFHPQHWNIISKTAKNFISQLLKLNIAERMTLKDAIEHSWITNTLNKNIYPNMKDTLQETLARQRWRCLGLTANAIHNFTLASPTLTIKYGLK